MNALKERDNKPKDGRRSFIRKMGAAMSVGVLASSVPATAKSAEANNSDMEKSIGELSERLAFLEAEKSIIDLYHTYESLLNDGLYDKIPELFVTDGEVVYNGGVFRGRDKGVTRLYKDKFRSGFTGKKLDAALDSKEGQSIDISQDYLFAKAGFPFAIQAGAPMVSDSVLVSMARLHGEGINKWHEKGVCNLSLTRKSNVDVWMIKRFEYCTESKSLSMPGFTKVFPVDPAGPDTLI
ncbi:MAG: nuclear transport factor 2 family protein [Prolixibacteraceae bacterium]|nr:nuclear transport factor 2 family protein [Prolixibacteraceae bacterium]MBN2774129.1 nuclear transport factor 2 family protein [Prolixibacteraceae bacterium]